jgi:hypothetical protein
MTDEETPRRRRWWPQSVRVRLTVVATLAFAITLSAAAFGLVRVVHTNLLDRIQETNQTQLDELQSAVRRGALQPPPVRECYQVPGGYLCSQAHPDRSGVEAAQREIQTTAGNITLVAQQSTAAVNRTVHSVTNVLLVVVQISVQTDSQ